MRMGKGGSIAETKRAEQRHEGLFCQRWMWCAAVLAVLAAMPAVAQQTPQNGQQPNSGQQAGQPSADRAWTSSPPLAIPVPQSDGRKVEAADAERRRQIAEDSAKLLKLATDLKAEVDKTSKDTLSLTVIRKADEIERLARGVKEKMKLTVGAN
jgi:hypothetical protein